jgi:hypothetical protein
MIREAVAAGASCGCGLWRSCGRRRCRLSSRSKAARMPRTRPTTSASRRRFPYDVCLIKVIMHAWVATAGREMVVQALCRIDHLTIIVCGLWWVLSGLNNRLILYQFSWRVGDTTGARRH